MTQMLQTMKAGQEITLTVKRRGADEPLEIKVKLGKRRGAR